MLAIKGIYQNGQVKLTESIGEIKKTTKVIVLFIDDEADENHALEMAKLQETTGFARDVLANPAEDVWNDL